MVKNWADHCASSDEEDLDFDEPIEVPNTDVLRKEIDSENKAFYDDHDAALEDEEHAAAEAAAAAAAGGGPPAKRTYEFPTEAPFTAYVGNLAYSIVESNDLTEKLTTLVKDLLGADIKITESRIMMDRRNPSPKPRHRGFAYVQVETLDMLKTLMELNNKEATLEGRQLTLDTSTTNNHNNNRRGSRNDGGGGSSSNNNNFADGSQFRGGRFGNNNRRPSQQQRRQSDKRDEPIGGGGGGPPPPTGQRPSLKLAPRTKPIEGNSGSQSNIFGGAKPRDEQTWQERRKSAATRNNESAGAGGGANSSNTGGRHGGRGGGERGGRGGDRRGGRSSNGRGGGRSSFKDNNNHKERKEKPKPAAAAAVAAAPAPVESLAPVLPTAANAVKPADKPAEKKVVNKFAALDFSDSD